MYTYTHSMVKALGTSLQQHGYSAEKKTRSSQQVWHFHSSTRRSDDIRNPLQNDPASSPTHSYRVFFNNSKSSPMVSLGPVDIVMVLPTPAQNSLVSEYHVGELGLAMHGMPLPCMFLAPRVHAFLLIHSFDKTLGGRAFVDVFEMYTACQGKVFFVIAHRTRVVVGHMYP